MTVEKTVIAVDFDGTVVTHSYPRVGDDAPYAANALRWLLAASPSVRYVLWTMRSGDTLADAVAWYERQQIPLFGVNVNPEQHEWTQSPKAYANIYIDDAALGCPLLKLSKHERPVVDWARLMPMLCRKLEIAYSKHWKSA